MTAPRELAVLGISGLDRSRPFRSTHLGHLPERDWGMVQGEDAAAALVTDAGIIAAAAEERFARVKQTGSFPIHAIRYCLEEGGLDIDDVDIVAHGFSYEPVRRYYEADPFYGRFFDQVLARDVHLARLREHFSSVRWEQRFRPVPHHLAHAASCFFPSGFGRSLILISDAMGEVQSMTVAVGDGDVIEVLKEQTGLHSLGLLYSAFTHHLGFYMGSDEYKVMGLAPYGDPARFGSAVDELVVLKKDGGYAIPVLYANETDEEKETYAGTLRRLRDLFGQAREPESEITQDAMDLAAALQRTLERTQLHVLRHWRAATGLTDLCMAGGVALNCSANGKLLRSGLFERMFVQPAAGDDGTALGAALFVHRAERPGAPAAAMSLPLWGPRFGDDDIARALDESPAVAHIDVEPDELAREVAARLAAGNIVAWFQDRMEYGPRALGSRSILADPRDPAMRDRVNSLVKKREEFRPFAPIVKAEAASEIFDIAPGQEAVFAHMLYVTTVKPEYRDRLPATTHVDGSARVQTVFRDRSPQLWRLLDEFEKLAGLPVLLNTSFNVRGQPIVCTPGEAIETFLAVEFDVLAIGHHIVTRA